MNCLFTTIEILYKIPDINFLCKANMINSGVYMRAVKKKGHIQRDANRMDLLVNTIRTSFRFWFTLIKITDFNSLQH